MIRSLGPNSLCSKMDIKSAFRLLRIHLFFTYFHLLGFQFQGRYFIDKCLSVGCSMSCAAFERFSTFLEWAVKERSGRASVVHYLNDFLFAGPDGSPVCYI